jgi:TatD DNase family protein
MVMRYVDSHTHIDTTLEKFNWTDGFDKFRSEIINDLNCEKFIHISCEVGSISEGVNLISKHADVFGSFGIHPHEASDYNDDIEKKIIEVINEFRPKGKIVSYGEIGLDYHYNKSVCFICVC